MPYKIWHIFLIINSYPAGSSMKKSMITLREEERNFLTQFACKGNHRSREILCALTLFALAGIPCSLPPFLIHLSFVKGRPCSPLKTKSRTMSGGDFPPV
jgi:hypothetical protein